MKFIHFHSKCIWSFFSGKWRPFLSRPQCVNRLRRRQCIGVGSPAVSCVNLSHPTTTDCVLDSPIDMNTSTTRQHDQHYTDGSFKQRVSLIANIMLLKCDPGRLNDNKTTLDQVMAWRQTGDNTLLKPITIQFTDAYLRHSFKTGAISN